MLLDTNIVINHIRLKTTPTTRAFLPIVVVGELEVFALKADWGYQKLNILSEILSGIPIIDINQGITKTYAIVDAYSQGLLKHQPLPTGLSARNMGKNDLWIAATALFYDLELHSTDNDFDHLPAIGLQLIKSRL
jgi:predicted nucleic acid-binding protein